MKINIGSADRKLRAFVVAPVLVVAGIENYANASSTATSEALRRLGESLR